MHEQSIMTNLMGKIANLAKDNGAASVKGVSVTLGALSHFTPEHFQEHFDIAAKGSVCEDAKLTITMDQDLSAPYAQDVLLEAIEVDDN